MLYPILPLDRPEWGKDLPLVHALGRQLAGCTGSRDPLFNQHSTACTWRPRDKERLTSATGSYIYQGMQSDRAGSETRKKQTTPYDTRIVYWAAR